MRRARQLHRSSAAFFAAALAFAIAWLAPAVAHAKILPACELREQVSLMPVANSPTLESVATGEPSDDADWNCDAADGDHAGMCDERGATAFAPPRLLPVDGGTIDATHGCSSLDEGAASADQAKSPRDVPSATSSLAVVIDTTARPDLARGYILAPPYPPAGGRPLMGIARAIDHPPR